MIGNYKNIRPFVVGIGVAGKRHLEAQLNLGIKTGVYTTNPETAKLLRKNRNVIVFDNLEQGIDWSNLVHVCTPDDKHTEFVAAALKKGKAVLCEKSFTTDLKDALYLQKLAHQYNTTVIVGQNYRLTPTFTETREKIFKGQLGTITKIETTYFHDKTDYQQRYSSNKEQDFLYMGGSHAVDLACWTSGEPVRSVKAISQKKLNYKITLKFFSGLLGYVNLDASSPRSLSGTDLVVYGEKGKLASNNKIDELLFYKKGDKKPEFIKLPNNKTLTIPLEISIVDDYLFGKNQSYSPLPGVDEVLKTIKVLDAIQKAVSSGKNETISY